RKTPLASRHELLSARMVDFSGWYMPVQYTGIIEEHQKTRSHVTVFDTCHMGRIRIEGRDSQSWLSGMFTTDVNRMDIGMCRYGFLLNEEGGVLDDTITYKIGSDSWLVVVNAGTIDSDLDWLRSHCSDDVTVENISATTGKIDVQGPESREHVESLLSVDLSQLGYFRFIHVAGAGNGTIVSRSGYTGEEGYELYADTDVILSFWDDLIASGVVPAGLGARDTLRLEAGLPLYGHELSISVTPVEAGMSRFLGKRDGFVGKNALMTELRDGPSKTLVGFRSHGRQSARHGNAVFVENERTGQVTSGSFSPTLGYAIGMAYVGKEHATPGARLDVDIGRKRIECEIVSIPFYNKKN
ncbi:MAG: glycine cleavage system aminomethyltransferase GcvT, partial [Lentisphaerae bacterium]|nr:glycine cleavage system aminomethyltransferase GcvT [Lentisphaerota bacterium]